MRYLIAAPLFLIAGAAHGQTPPPAEAPPESLTAVYACSQINEDAERLHCFDAAVSQLRQAANQGEFVAVDRRRVEEIRRESFGFSLPSVASLIPRIGGNDNAAQEQESIQVRIAQIITRPDGYYIFVMADGQRWRQTERRHLTFRAGDQVTIRRASMGSFMLVPEGNGGAHRVHREN